MLGMILLSPVSFFIINLVIRSLQVTDITHFIALSSTAISVYLIIDAFVWNLFGVGFVLGGVCSLVVSFVIIKEYSSRTVMVAPENI
jgi:hypothetical protein